MGFRAARRLPDHLVDTTLVAPPYFFEAVCLPVRFGVGASLLLSPWICRERPASTRCRWVFALLSVVLGLAAVGLYRKWNRLGGRPPGAYPGGWKNFRRAVAAAAAASALLAGAGGGLGAWAAGAVIVADAAMGLQSKLAVVR